MKTYILNINPVSKPRMTQSDKWRQRPSTSRYWTFKDEINILAIENKMPDLPQVINVIDFYIPMPESWSKKKKELMCGKLHQNKPDLDNLLKSLQDSLCKNDQHISQINRLSKTWDYEGKIEIEF